MLIICMSFLHYHLLMRSVASVCVCLCLSACPVCALTSESLNQETLCFGMQIQPQSIYTVSQKSSHL